ncbi:MAG: phycobilisome rod-core linker polypeptide [Synechococcaceae cyanobacterium]|nr:phycobilisome rod-core linker polypeptide [Synechococcaceae cyanobacterium]
MPLPLLNVAPISSNARVRSFAVGSDETPRQLTGNRSQGSTSVDAMIEQAYRQIYFHAFQVDRDSVLESQLRSNQITVRDFVRSLLLSRKFRDDFYRTNSNYQMVEQVVGRVLGRPVHGDRERIALSILVAEKGLPALVDQLLDSEEYLENFGYDQVPFQRGRVLAGRAQGAMPFNQQAPRYGRYWRDISAKRAPAGSGSGWQPSGGFSMQRPAWLADAPSPLARSIWQGVVATAGFGITGLVLYTAAVMFSTASVS